MGARLPPVGKSLQDVERVALLEAEVVLREQLAHQVRRPATERIFIELMTSNRKLKPSREGSK